MTSKQDIYSKRGEYEKKYKEAQDIATSLTNGNTDLTDSLSQYEHGVKIIRKLYRTMKNATDKVAKIETNDDQEVPFDRDKNGKDIKDDVKIPQQKSSVASRRTTNATRPKSAKSQSASSSSNSGESTSKTSFNPSTLF